MNTLTRAEAIAIVDDAQRDGAAALLALAAHWIGHSDYPDMSADDLAQFLYEYIGECASTREDRTPRGDDPTELDNPED